VDERLGYRNKAIFYDSFSENRFAGNKKVSIGSVNAFAPSIISDSKDNLYVVWSTFEGDGMGKLYFRCRIDGSWSREAELADRGVIESLLVDSEGNVHFVWGDGSNIFHKVKCESFWTKTVNIEGQNARICIDRKNKVHLFIYKTVKEGYYVLIHNILQSK
jgi:beta-xylosidase